MMGCTSSSFLPRSLIHNTLCLREHANTMTKLESYRRLSLCLLELKTHGGSKPADKGFCGRQDKSCPQFCKNGQLIDHSYLMGGQISLQV